MKKRSLWELPQRSPGVNRSRAFSNSHKINWKRRWGWGGGCQVPALFYKSSIKKFYIVLQYSCHLSHDSTCRISVSAFQHGHIHICWSSHGGQIVAFVFYFGVISSRMFNSDQAVGQQKHWCRAVKVKVPSYWTNHQITSAGEPESNPGHKQNRIYSPVRTLKISVTVR